MTHSAVDVLVVGDGPAGAAAALVLGRNGIGVRLLAASPSRGKVPGETLNRGALEAFAELGLRELPASLHGTPHTSIWRAHGPEPLRREDLVDAHGRPEPGLHVDRDALRHALHGAVVEAGVQLELGTSAVDVILDRGRVVGASTDQHRRRARWVVDASGRRQWLAHRLGLWVARWGPRRYVTWGYARGAHGPATGASVFRETTDGWTWVARVAPTRHAWVRCGPAARSLSTPPPELLGLEQEAGIGGSDLTWRLVRPTAGDGYLLCGDAAFVLDPSLGDGVERALRAGMCAGRTLLRLLKKPAAEALELACYDDLLVRAFEARTATARQTSST